MKQLARDGVKIAGLFRSSNGGIVVNDALALKKAFSEKERIESMQRQIDGLNNKVNELVEMVKTLVNKNGN